MTNKKGFCTNASIIALAALLSGCASLKGWTGGHSDFPQLHEYVDVNVLGIQRLIECELNKARKSAPNDWLKDRFYSARLEFQVTDNLGIDPTLGVVEQIGTRVASQQVSVPTGGVLNKTTFREAVVNFGTTFEKLKSVEINELGTVEDKDKNECTGKGTVKFKNSKNEYTEAPAILNGKLGIYDWLKDLGKLADYLNGREDEIGTISHNFSFTYSADLSVNPTFTLIPITFNSISPGLDFDVDRERFYFLGITIMTNPQQGVTEVALSETGLAALEKSLEKSLRKASQPEAFTKGLRDTQRESRREKAAPQRAPARPRTNVDPGARNRAEQFNAIEAIESLDNQL